MFRWLPFMIFPAIIYNVVVLFGNVLFGHEMLSTMEAAVTIPMVSKDVWKFSFGDGLIVFSLLMLFIETLKSSGSDKRTMLNHALSMVLLVGCMLEFIILKGFATSVFFFITLMALFDTVGGPLISIVASRRDMALGHDVAGLDPNS